MKGIAILAGLLATGASAHMQMMKPYPIRSPLNKDSNEKKDYSYNNPLSSSGSDFPCKGYNNDPFQSQATYSPGQTYDLELDGSATHGGGSCQISLTYDRGKTFKVIESMLGECPISKNYTFQIPSDAPSGEALLAWTWFNKIGNREMYMNCAMVTISGSDSSGNKTQSISSKGKNVHSKNLIEKVMDGEIIHMNHLPMENTVQERDMTEMTGQSKATAFDSLPAMFIANVQQEGGCVTIEGEEVNFPEPGPNVVGKTDGNGNGYKCSSNAPFLGSDSSSSGSSSSSSSSSASTSSTTGSTSSTPASTSSTPVSPSSTPASTSSKSDSKNSNTSSSQNSDKSTKQTKPPATTTSSTTSQAMSMIASAFGSPSSDPRVLGSQSGQASTNNDFSSYVEKFTCVSGEILCSPDGYSWAMCSNGRPIFMGNVAPGMTCRLGQMVRAG
jgi:hypothetical protein